MTTETVYQVYLRAYTNLMCGQEFQLAPNSDLTLFAAAALGAAAARERLAIPQARIDVERSVTRMCESCT